MRVVVLRDTVGPDPDDPVIPAGTIGEVCGDGYATEDGYEFIAVDFGNVACDVPVEDLKVAD